MLLVSLVAAAFAGWTQPAGGHYTKIGGRYTYGWRAFASELSPGSQGEDIDPINDAQLLVYTEHGLTDAWTLVAEGNPIGRATFRNASLLYSGTLQLGLRRGLRSGQHNLSVQADGGYAPGLGDRDLTDGAYDGLVFVPGVSTALVRGRVSYGTPTRRGGWIKATAGAEVLTTLHPAALLDLQVGRIVNDRHRLTVGIPVRLTLGPDDDVTNISGAGNRDFLALTLGYAHLPGSGWGVGGDFDTGVAAGSALGGVYLSAYAEHTN